MAAVPDNEEKESDIVILRLTDEKSEKVVNEAQIHLYGATVISWKVNDRERLFMSKSAKLDGSIDEAHGGRPVVFPQFAGGPMKHHGFARVLTWKVEQSSLKDSSSVTLVLENIKNDKIEAILSKDPWNWNDKFRLEYTVSLTDKNSMKNELKIFNKNDNEKTGSFSFTVLYHNYFWVDNVKNIKIDGVPCCKKLFDNVNKKIINDEKSLSNNNGLVIENEADFVYYDHENKQSLTLLNSDSRNKNDKIEINKGGVMKDIVIWNPGKDFGNEYLNMVCLEVGYVDKEKNKLLVLQPGESCLATQNLTVVT